MKNTKKHYYDIRDDIKKFPLAWLYCVWSKRGPGKTYSALRMCVEEKVPFIYVKRTNKDIDFICSSSRFKTKTKKDPSPFAPLNRDFKWNIKPVKIMEGFAGFYECDDENNPLSDEPIGYALSLNKVIDVKGFELSFCEYLIFDEFIPLKGQVVKKAEGEMLLSLYMTVSRDRQARGRGPLKMILFANAEQLVTPITSTIEIVDDIALVDYMNERYMYIEERGILLHHITKEECPLLEEEKEGIYKGMQGTAWFDNAFGGNFSTVDYTNVKRDKRLTGYNCIIAVKYKRKWIYIYYSKNNSDLYASSKPATAKNIYDLERDNDQVLFFENERPFLFDMCINDRFKFEKYTYYDLVINYKDYFKV